MVQWLSAMIRRLLPVFVVAAAIVVAVLLTDEAAPAPSGPPAVPCDVAQSTAAVDKLKKLLTFRTTSNPSATLHVDHEDQFHAAWAYLEEAYPLIWERLQVDKVGAGGLSRLFTWKAADSSALPLLFIAHMDVVSAGDESAWTHPAFGGQEADGYIWGRGAVDMKQVLMGILEAIQQLLSKGYTPSRDVLFAVGHDEEVGGEQGAQEIAKVVSSRYSKLDFIVDEGGALFQDGLKPFGDQPVQVLGTAEKGYVSINVKISAEGGHSSMPPGHKRTAVELAGQFINRISTHPMAPRLQSPFKDTLNSLLHVAPRPVAFVLKYAHIWPLSDLLARAVQRRGMAQGANVYTPVVVTRVNAGVGDNVIPEDVHILLNSRPLQGDTVADILAYVNSSLAAAGVKDGEATVQLKGKLFQPSNIADVNSRLFKAVKQAVQETVRVGGGAVAVAPALLPGGTDSRHYDHLSVHGTVRITGGFNVNATAGDMKRLHGVDERVGTEAFLQSICIYKRIIELLTV